MLGQLIGAGISAIASLFGGDDEQKTTTEVDYEKMAYNAEKAGFNPLTAIRNGGSAGFVTTTHPALSMGTRIGNMFSTLGNSLMSFDFNADKRAGLENKLLEAQIGRIQQETSLFSTSRFGDVPSAAGSTRVGPGNRAVGALGSETNPYNAFNWVQYVDRVTGKTVKYMVPNVEIMPDDPSGLLVPGLAEGVEQIWGPKSPMNPRRPGLLAPWSVDPPKMDSLIHKGSTVDPYGELLDWWSPNTKPRGPSGVMGGW